MASQWAKDVTAEKAKWIPKLVEAATKRIVPADESNGGRVGYDRPGRSYLEQSESAEEEAEDAEVEQTVW